MVDESKGLRPFNPPYTLAGTAALVLGTWAAEPPLPDTTVLDGYNPVRLFGRLLAIVVANDFQQPPRQLPIRYHEVIASVLLRRGLRFASLPFAMRLDAPLPVELGRLYYRLPKQLDAALDVRIEPGELRLSGSAELHARVRPALRRLLLLPLSALVSFGAWAFTHLTVVVGAAGASARQARIALTPRSVGRPYALSVARVAGFELHPWWCQGYAHCETELGPPIPLQAMERP